MKALVFLLVLANLLFYAFSSGYFGHSDNPDAARIDRDRAANLDGSSEHQRVALQMI